VLLHRPLAHEQGSRDGRVAAAGRHLLQDLALAVRQPRQRRGLVRPALEEPLHDLRIECRASSGHLLERAHQLVEVRHPFLEEVPQARHPVLQQVDRVVGLDILREHDDAHRWVLAADPPRRVDHGPGAATGTRAVRHLDPRAPLDFSAIGGDPPAAA
jgi:hypothetical protein